MKKALLVTTLLLASSLAGTAFAQGMRMPFNDAGVTMGHWHLNSSNIEASKKIFVGMGGKWSKPGDFDIVTFPGVIVNLHLRPGNPGPTGGTPGTVVNHTGFIVKNVQEQSAQWKAAGVPVLPGNNGQFDRQAFVVTPDGLRIEVLEDKTQAMPIRHEHVHFFLPEAEMAKSQAWYAKTFGAKAGTRNNAMIADVPGVQLRFAKADAPQKTTKGTALDHIGFDVKDMLGFIKKLDADGIKLDRPYSKNEATGDSLAFITDPWGTYIELNERTKGW